MKRNIVGKPVNETFAPVRYAKSEQDSEFAIAERKTVYEYLSRYVMMFNITPPEINKKQSLEGCIKRLSNNCWWLPKMRKIIRQANEKAAIQLNFVNSKRQIYASIRLLWVDYTSKTKIDLFNYIMI